MSMFLDKLQLVAHEPLTYVAFLVLVGAWLWRAYFLRTQAYVASLKSLPERDQLSALQLLALGYPQKVTANHLKLLQQRYLLVAFIATLVSIIILGGLLVHYLSLSDDEIKKRLGHIEDQGDQANKLMTSIGEKADRLAEQTAQFQSLLAQDRAERDKDREHPPSLDLINARNKLEEDLANVQVQLEKYVRLYGELPRPQLHAQIGEAKQAAERLYGKKSLVYPAFLLGLGYLNAGCWCSLSGR
jgi:hypothetical protein